MHAMEGKTLLTWDQFVAEKGGLSAEELSDGLWRLSEPGLVPECRSNFYALETPDALVMIDGGWGLARSLADFPMLKDRALTAIATHSHSDHIGALHLAGQRYGHAAEAGVFADPDPFATQARPWIDDLAFAEGGMTVDPASYRQFPCPLTHIVENGEELRFGPLSLHVLWTPGHSAGSICLFEARKGWLFCADTVHDGYIFDDIPGADPEALSRSHSILCDLDFSQAFPGHGDPLSHAGFQERIVRYKEQKAV